ncbi:hypothetical protein GCM10007978_05190 [Shewanella hanedai]|uniref:Uncharacterized protein n=1 Tax=Shewanella hanedai TaxID=25 RepID=A0A553JTR6_SHEHA|nr:hypothetical protein [Shewanella hanedai]TRY15830.1 hypothetical protein FN961_02270 [Shewanella hanedai]GGI70205.1 hypothetical protein GCM10007978_05190 [Shewanella hanedai]
MTTERATIASVFNHLVDLFKSLPNVAAPNLNWIKVDDNFSLTQSHVDHLTFLYQNRWAFNEFDIEIDYAAVCDWSVGANCTKINLTLKSDDSGNRMCFVQSEQELISKFSVQLARGAALPTLFYVINSEHQSNVDETTLLLSKLEMIQEWLSLFRNVADIVNVSNKGESQYFILKTDEDKFVKPFEFSVAITEELLSLDISPIGDFKALINSEGRQDLNIEEKRNFFKLAFVELLKKLTIETPQREYVLLVFENIERLKTSYDEHYEVFIHNFALSEFHDKVEEKYFEYAEKIQAVLGDIQTKIYAIPAVLIGMGMLAKVNTFEAYVFVVGGIFFTSLFTHWMLCDQIARLSQITDSMEFVFKKLSSKGAERLKYEEVVQDISTMKRKLEKSIEKRKHRLLWYIFYSWFPLVITVVLVLIKYSDKLLKLSLDFLL